MPPRQKAIALMRWQDRMKASEIAAALGVALAGRPPAVQPPAGQPPAGEPPAGPGR